MRLPRTESVLSKKIAEIVEIKTSRTFTRPISPFVASRWVIEMICGSRRVCWTWLTLSTTQLHIVSGYASTNIISWRHPLEPVFAWNFMRLGMAHGMIWRLNWALHRNNEATETMVIVRRGSTFPWILVWRERRPKSWRQLIEKTAVILASLRSADWIRSSGSYTVCTIDMRLFLTCRSRSHCICYEVRHNAPQHSGWTCV